MKVYYIGGGYDGCYYVRCLLPLVNAGWDGMVYSLRAKKVSPEQMLQGALASDIVVFQRPMQREMVEAAKHLKKVGKLIVMDNDDTYKDNAGVQHKFTGTNNMKKVTEHAKKIDSVLKEFAEVADMITVSTEVLAKEYREIHDNVVVLPNCIDPDYWPEPKRHNGKVRIGFAGSVIQTKDFYEIEPLIRKLGQREDVEIVIFAVPPVSFDTQKVRMLYKKEIKFWKQFKNVYWQHTVNIADYMETLNKLEMDIMLIPRTDNYFNRCKSNIKFLEAAMLEIPVVAQAFKDGLSPYQHNPKDADFMKLAYNNKEFEKETFKLIEDKAARRKLGKEARKYVLKHYHIKKNLKLWQKAYETLWRTKHKKTSS
jgi:glycosyltransferase involved in cell wall biosynthesis